jgi:thiamine monophosphate synthase
VKNNKLDYYIFIEELNEKIVKNIISLKRRKLRLNIIILDKNFLIVSEFAKKYDIAFFIIDNIKLAKQLNANGIFLTNKNKILRSNIKETTKLEVIGSAHNQREYYIKQKQNCSTVMLSPIFYNKKYSPNKILYVSRFNLITLNWKTRIAALGGINFKNLKLVNLTKSECIGIKSLITD